MFSNPYKGLAVMFLRAFLVAALGWMILKVETPSSKPPDLAPVTEMLAQDVTQGALRFTKEDGTVVECPLKHTVVKAIRLVDGILVRRARPPEFEEPPLVYCGAPGDPRMGPSPMYDPTRPVVPGAVYPGIPGLYPQSGAAAPVPGMRPLTPASPYAPPGPSRKKDKYGVPGTPGPSRKKDKYGVPGTPSLRSKTPSRRRWRKTNRRKRRSVHGGFHGRARSMGDRDRAAGGTGGQAASGTRRPLRPGPGVTRAWQRHEPR